MHPHNAKKWKRETLEELEEVASDPQCVAIGECGLDFNRNFSDKKIQMDVFEKQVQANVLRSPKYLLCVQWKSLLIFVIGHECFSQQVQLACKLQKPMVLHERDAFREMNEILNKYQTMLPPVVIHCFTGSRQEAIKYIGMGYYIGITGKFLVLSAKF